MTFFITGDAHFVETSGFVSFVVYVVPFGFGLYIDLSICDIFMTLNVKLISAVFRDYLRFRQHTLKLLVGSNLQ